MLPPLITLIATAGGNADLRDTLRSLAACDLPEGYRKTIVIENGGRQGAEEIVTETQGEHPHLACEYQFAERPNKSNALNECLATLDENFLLFMTDDDIEFDPRVLTEFSEAARESGEHVVYGGMLKVRSTGEAPEELQEFLPISATGFPRREYRDGQDFLGANWAAFAEDLKAIGGFDPRFGPGSPHTATGQESEMMRQLRRRGMRFQYVPGAVVWHQFDASGYSLDFLSRRSFRNGVEHGQRLWLRRAEGEQTPWRWDLAKSRVYSTLLPLVTLVTQALAPKRLHARLIAALNAGRGRLEGWNALKNETQRND
ncbi:Glycosyl transferase family 2 [Planctomycetes bacterium MalM25]|nr:Glycosyl transferase family 2 [Planctomycetes bacterium MalM25]